MIRLDPETLHAEAKHAIIAFEAPEDIQITVHPDTRSVRLTLGDVATEMRGFPEFEQRENIQRALNFALARLAYMDIERKCDKASEKIPDWLAWVVVKLHLWPLAVWWMKRQIR